MRARLAAIAGEGLTNDLWVGTYHATCARLLRRYHSEVGLERGFVIYDDSDQKAVMGRVLKDLDLSDRTHPPKLVLSRVQRQKAGGDRPGHGARRSWLRRSDAGRVRGVSESAAPRERRRFRGSHPLRAPHRGEQDTRGRRAPRSLSPRAGGRIPGHQRHPVSPGARAVREDAKPRRRR